MVSNFNILNLDELLKQISQFEISKVFDIWLRKYKD